MPRVVEVTDAVRDDIPAVDPARGAGGHAAAHRAAHDLPGRPVPARLARGAVYRVANRAAGGAGDRAEAAAAAAGAADRSGRPAARRSAPLLAIVLLVRDLAGGDQRRRRAGGVLGGQAAGGDPADPAAARLSRPSDRHDGMDDGAVAERRGWRRQRAAGVVRAPVVQRDGGAVQRHRHGRGGPVHHAGGAVLPAGVRRDVPAPSGRNPAELRREASGGRNHAAISSATSPSIWSP